METLISKLLKSLVRRLNNFTLDNYCRKGVAGLKSQNTPLACSMLLLEVVCLNAERYKVHVTDLNSCRVFATCCIFPYSGQKNCTPIS